MTRQKAAMLVTLVLLLSIVSMSYLWGMFQQEGEIVQDVALVHEVDIELQKQALFALSQSSSEQSLKHLIEFATTHKHPEVRKQAIFWLGQKESRAALEALDQIAEEDPSLEVQKQILFAYSQMPQEVGSPRLVRIARSHERREMQEQAIFWLGQQGGEDALALFDEIIAGEAEGIPAWRCKSRSFLPTHKCPKR